jgi:Domain of unknown function (DUF222)
MSISEGPGQHPITAALTLMEQALTGAADAAAWSLPDEDVLEALHHGERLAARLAGLQLRLIGEADARDVASRLGAPSTAALLRQRLRLHPGDAVRTLTAVCDGAVGDAERREVGLRDSVVYGEVRVWACDVLR